MLRHIIQKTLADIGYKPSEISRTGTGTPQRPGRNYLATALALVFVTVTDYAALEVLIGSLPTVSERGVTLEALFRPTTEGAKTAFLDVNGGGGGC